MPFSNLFSPEHSMIGEIIKESEYPWDVLKNLSDIIIEIGKCLSDNEYDHISEFVWIAKTATVAPTALINGPCIICDGAEIRHCAFIRGSAVIGKGAVVGNSCEIKNSVIYDKAQIPHFNYVGDSVLGFGAHLGAGAITSNVKGDKSNVRVRYEGAVYESGRKKLGAIIGDHAEIGCNTVLNPGTVIGNGARVYPLCSVRGTIDDNMLMKSADNIVMCDD